MLVNKEFLELVKENPDLPVYAWVDSEVILDDSYGYWLGQICHARVAQVLTGWFDRVFDDKDEFKEYYFDYHDEEFEGLSDEEMENKLEEICEAQDWLKAILITVSAV